MEEQILFNEGGFLVTTLELVYKDRYFQLNSIKSIDFTKIPRNNKALIINYAVVIASIYAIVTFTIINFILGLIGLFISGSNLNRMYKDYKNPMCSLNIEFHSNSPIRIARVGVDFAIRLKEAVHTALIASQGSTQIM